ncbi:charged multivesicular body protein 1b-1-like isoform X3 [Silurus meridionalis]|uniref:charged multivesicular body protein 1b-1-like isoform X3 n=1 Tax=Silurus meridionalis TaxID=175797 RepID=UPI001EEAB1BE|nr:charged multivesicular body protein 1b-1-like isoform X3 [Silurus meridionalis]
MSNMEKHLFNLKFAAKELDCNAKKCYKEEKAEKAKVKKVTMEGVVKSMDAKKSMNLQMAFSFKWTLWHSIMDSSKRVSEEARLPTKCQMRGRCVTSIQNKVQSLMQEMEDEAGVALNMELPLGQTGSVGTSLTLACTR